MKQKFETYDEFMCGARKGRTLTNSIGRKIMTLGRLQGLILQGFGQGRGEGYTPWIRVTRGNAPRKSNHVVAVTHLQARPLHLLSRLEYRAVRLAMWLGGVEVREQFPLWPWAGGPHPMAGLDEKRDHALPATPGLLAIAKKAGIRHGHFVGAPDLPYVATTDLVIRVGDAPNERLAFWSCKPAAVLADPKKGPAAKERIDLERLYARAVGAHHAVYDGTCEPGVLSANLDWLEPPRSEMNDAALTVGRAAFALAFNQTKSEYATESRIQAAAAALDMPLPLAQQHFRAAAWLGAIDVDLSFPIVMSRPLMTGGTQLKRQLFAQLMGGAQ